MGRNGVFEVFRVTDKIQEAIVDEASEREIQELAVKDGMVTLREAGRQKVVEGITDFDELSRVITLKTD